jgi:hypothetical protein
LCCQFLHACLLRVIWLWYCLLHSGLFEVRYDCSIRYVHLCLPHLAYLYIQISRQNTPKPLVTEESLSVKHRSNESGRRQLYRINLFNTTNMVDINGYMLSEFISTDLPMICKACKKFLNLKHLNDKIRNVWCSLFLLDFYMEVTVAGYLDLLLCCQFLHACLLRVIWLWYCLLHSGLFEVRYDCSIRYVHLCLAIGHWGIAISKASEQWIR